MRTPLGNVMAVISDRGVVQSAQDYFPFGMAMPGRSTGVYRYGFNGKETDPETGLNDFGARLYDGRLGRWLAVDPLEKKYPGHSPYLAMKNNPILLIDPNGMDWTDKNGKKVEGNDLNQVKVYIFYTDEFKSQAFKYYDKCIETFGADKVVLSNTGTAEGFSKDWANMQGGPAEVAIMAHGKNQSINIGNNGKNVQFVSTGDGITNIGKTPNQPNIQDLPTPKADLIGAYLNLYSCHSADTKPEEHGEGTHKQGALRGSKLCVAQAFHKNFDFAAVIGTAGSVNFLNWSEGFDFWVTRYLEPFPQDKLWVKYTRKVEKSKKP